MTKLIPLIIFLSFSFMLCSSPASYIAQLTKQAQGGKVQACFLLGQHYMARDPTIKHNRIQTKKWFKKALAYKPHAGFLLGRYLLEQGPSKHDEAKKYLLSAAKLGDLFAPYLLSVIESDPNEQAKWNKLTNKLGIGWEEYTRYQQLCDSPIDLLKE